MKARAYTGTDGDVYLHIDGRSAAAVWAALESLSLDFREARTRGQQEVGEILTTTADALKAELDRRILRCAATVTGNQS